jgi:alpha-N-arabinofuranosidase
MRFSAGTALFLLGICFLGPCLALSPLKAPPLCVLTQHELQDPAIINATINFDLGIKKPITPTLFGIFFEEIGHAGDGGLYAEMIQDRSFDATAAAFGFSVGGGSGGRDTDLSKIFDNNFLRMPLDLEKIATYRPHPVDSIVYPAFNASSVLSKEQRLSQILTSRGGDDASSHNEDESNRKHLGNIIVPWMTLAGTSATLTRELPLNVGNQVAMELTVSTTAPQNQGGLINYGYWGIALEKYASYEFSVYVRNPQAEDIEVLVALTSADLSTKYAEVTLRVDGNGGGGGGNDDEENTNNINDSSVSNNGQWKKYKGILTSNSTDTDARLMLSFNGPATLIIDSLSLFPIENIEKGTAVGHRNPWPFREDLLQALKALRPGFLRFPGGCFVEGDLMRNAFYWKKSIGGVEERPGHYNLWGYWSSDGLGVFEYMTLAEELDTEPVWVINNGVAHGDSVPPSKVLPLLQDVLDSIEFITGPANSTWGSRRAEMGREEPWNLNYVAIGNEDCGKPFYVQNYNLFYGALHAAYPHLRLISNCDMGTDGPTDIWDWHVYTNPQNMFNLQTAFDGRDPAAGHLVFASEYAVTDGGGWGNVIGAVSEAAFMTGLERNGQAVHMAAYAPLFVHWNDRPWPTNMIVINNHEWFGIPSYHVQRLFRETQGTHYIATTVLQPPGEQGGGATIAASATCQHEENSNSGTSSSSSLASTSCSTVAIKLVNFSPAAQIVAVNMLHSGATAADSRKVASEAEAVVITSENPEDENSFEDPLKVAPFGVPLDGLSNSFAVELAPWSVNVMQVHLEKQKEEVVEPLSFYYEKRSRGSDNDENEGALFA